MIASLQQTRHRPWPLPRAPWVMRMTWQDLAFLHWRVDADVIQRRLPPGLHVDLHRGEAWLGIVPFTMRSVRPRFTVDVPGLSHFPELNVRTYVTDGEKPGVWFFSLDAHNRVAVRLARTTFHLPYFDAQMRCERHGEIVDYESTRTHRAEPAARLRARYGPLDAPRDDDADLVRWLTERYCLYAATPEQRVLRGEVHHMPWVVRPGWCTIDEESLCTGDGLPAVEGEPLVHVAESIDVVAWAPRRI